MKVIIDGYNKAIKKKFKCIFRCTNYITKIPIKNSHTTIIRELKNSDSLNV